MEDDVEALLLVQPIGRGRRGTAAMATARSSSARWRLGLGFARGRERETPSESEDKKERESGELGGPPPLLGRHGDALELPDMALGRGRSSRRRPEHFAGNPLKLLSFFPSSPFLFYFCFLFISFQ